MHLTGVKLIVAKARHGTKEQRKELTSFQRHMKAAVLIEMKTKCKILLSIISVRILKL